MNIRPSAACLALASLVLTAQPASAAMSGTNLTIGDITIDGPDKARIYITGGLVGTANPSCPSYPSHFGIDLTTTKGKSQLAMATAAMLGARLIYVGGSGTQCLQVGWMSIQALDWMTLI